MVNATVPASSADECPKGGCARVQVLEERVTGIKGDLALLKGGVGALLLLVLSALIALLAKGVG